MADVRIVRSCSDPLEPVGLEKIEESKTLLRLPIHFFQPENDSRSDSQEMAKLAMLTFEINIVSRSSFFHLFSRGSR